MRDWNEIKVWRKERRVHLIAARTAVADDERKDWGKRISELIEIGFAPLYGGVVGLYWPYKGEYDARHVVRSWRQQGTTTALPEVVEKAHPLRFRKWWPGAPMRSGVYDIPVPDGTLVLRPDVVIVPMNGFDGRGYRLGYGGGYFDRTLATLERKVLAIGVSYELLRLPTIHPQAHDIPMDFVVTETGIYRAGGNNLAKIDATECVAEYRSMLTARGLKSHHDLFEATSQPRRAYNSPVCYAHEFSPDYFGES